MSSARSPQALSEEAISIVGVGLIGGSIAAALKKRGFSGRIIGTGRDQARLERARDAGLIDSTTTELAAACAESRLMIFATPIDLIPAGVRSAAEHARQGTLLTDVGSVKRHVCDALSGALPEGVTFIGSHPLAGSERRGFEHSRADLFEGCVCVITPEAGASPEQLERLKNFWQFLGLRVMEMPAADHDRTVAQTSHVPHVVAAALAKSLSEGRQELAASGFCDTTRIASGDPALWAGILLANADEVAGGLDVLIDELSNFRAIIAQGDAAALENLLQLAKTNRDQLMSAGSRVGS